MNRKRILSFIMVMVMVFAMAATACGKKEEVAEKEEPKQEEVSDTDDEDVEEDAEAADEEVSADKVKKTIYDTLTEEDIQSLKDSIRDAVISEYLEPNNIAVEDFVWPDKDSGEWGYIVALNEEYHLAVAIGYEMDVSKVDSSQYSNPELMEAAFNGIMNWISNQGNCDNGYISNVFETITPYYEVIPTIDLATK